MNPYKAYQAHRDPGLSRIDTLLALYEAAVEALRGALTAFGTNDVTAAEQRLGRARLAVTGLAGGVDPTQGDLPQHMLRLYEFVLHNLGLGTAEGVTAALDVLQTLQEGMLAIRPDALALERGGSIPPVTAGPQFLASA